MNKACFFFKLSDITRDLPRNYKRYPDVTRVKNFVYDDRYGKYTTADLFFVEGKDKYPVVVNVHGGGFVKGGKKYRRAICSEYAREGYFVYNIDYRLAPQYALPAAIEDVVTALNRLPELAEKYRLDLNTVVLTGDSAGGFYSLAGTIAALDPDFRALLGAPEVKVTPKAFMGFCGAYRLGDLLTKKAPLNMTVDIADALFGVKTHGDAEYMESLDNNVFTDLVRFVKEGFPKTFLLYSKSDSFCDGQGEILSEKLKRIGTDVTEYVATGKKDSHCFHLFPFHKTTPAVMSAAKDFLRSLRVEQE
ncbi:MAG: alpha/beta hydrolase [Clostridia bacterium]|nr:alpha/beta hydrolase [Clostridia bacterium]